VLLKNTVLAHGPTSDTFTQANLERAFGGVLRHFVLDQVPGGVSRPYDVFTDDERPLVLFKDRPERRDPSAGKDRRT
jgi:manganese/iron transport system ATP-binding protein